jgi:hypothetical protein
MGGVRRDLWTAPVEEHSEALCSAVYGLPEENKAQARRLRKRPSASPEEYRKIEQEILEQEKALAPKLKEIDREVTEVITPRLAALTDPFALARSEIQAVIYRVEVASSQSSKESLSKEIEKLKARPVAVSLPAGNGQVEKASLNFVQLEEEFNRLQQRKAELAGQRRELVKPVGELRAKLDAVMKERLTGLTETQVNGLLNKMRTFNVDIKQIHVKSVDLVDRCESCHLGIREPLTLTKADMGGEGAFTSHPTKALLQIHDPERFGCTPCHNGNGTATTSVQKAHGRYKHWLWPMYDKENAQAGCHQCHASDLVLDHATVLNTGKEIFRGKGCMGCHRLEGFDAEAEALNANRQGIRKMEGERKELEKNIELTGKAADAAPDNKEAQRLYAQADAFRQTISNIDHQMEQLDVQSRSLLREQKKVGPEPQGSASQDA